MSLKLKLSLIAIFISTFCQAQFEAKLIPKKGLFVNQGALQWAMGSEINFLNADRKHHEYYFTWWEQDADTTNPQQDILFIGSANTAVQGTFSLYRSNLKIRTSLQCVWNKKVLAYVIYYILVFGIHFSKMPTGQTKGASHFSILRKNLQILS